MNVSLRAAMRSQRLPSVRQGPHRASSETRRPYSSVLSAVVGPKVLALERIRGAALPPLGVPE